MSVNPHSAGAKLYPALRRAHRFGKIVFDALDRIGLRRLRPAALRLWWRVVDAAARAKRPGTVVLDGHTIHLDEHDVCRLSIFGVHEAPVGEVFRKYIEPGHAVADVGAHIGYFTLLAAKLAGPAGKVFAFEPEPSTFALLAKNIEANGYTNVVAMQKAVSDREGIIQLHLAGNRSGWHRIYPSKLTSNAIDVETITLDRVFETERIDFIKLDIEGAEPAAFRGMQRLLSRRRRPRIVLEFSPGAITEFGADPRQFLESLAGFGYRVLHVGAKGEEPVSFDDILRQFAPGLGTNLLLLPRES